MGITFEARDRNKRKQNKSGPVNGHVDISSGQGEADEQTRLIGNET